MFLEDPILQKSLSSDVNEDPLKMMEF